MTDWHPIATAPKDGTVVRLRCSVNGKAFEKVGQYVGLGAWREAGSNGGILMPTHLAPVDIGTESEHAQGR